MIGKIIMILIGFFMLIKGADILVSGAHSIAKKFKIPEIVIGLTIVSLGTSLPELMISVKSAMRGYADISIGNVIGSCICNLLFVLGVTAIIKPLKVEEATRKVEIPLSFIAIFLVAVFGNFNYEITKPEGILLLLFLGIFIFHLFYQMKNNLNQEVENEDSSLNLLKSMIYIILGIILLKYGGDFVVDYSSDIARFLGLNDKIIGLTIIAIGTSLPELVTGIVAVNKNDNQIAVGNIIGSNIFNLLLVLGISAVIRPIIYTVEFNLNLIFVFLISILVWCFSIFNKEHEIGKKQGGLLLLFYVMYLIYEFYTI